jgi:DNA-binding IclR family transcriptional regulator
VPAVRHAAAILRLLRSEPEEPATMTNIARALGLNGSTCHNLLKTLEQERLVIIDPTTRTYHLGLGLLDLAAGVSRQENILRATDTPMADFNRETNLACFLARRDRDGHFVLLKKIESRHQIKVTMDVGTRLPVDAPALLKVHLAWQPQEAIAEYFDTHPLPAYSDASPKSRDAYCEELDEVRKVGYGCSIREYHPDHNAIAAPIFDEHGQAAYELLTVGFSNDLPDDVRADVAALLTAKAREITELTSGRSPELLDTQQA